VRETGKEGVMGKGEGEREKGAERESGTAHERMGTRWVGTRGWQ